MASFTSSIGAAIYEVLFVFYAYPNAMRRKRRPLTALQFVEIILASGCVTVLSCDGKILTGLKLASVTQVSER